MQISLGENNKVIATCIYLYVTHFSRLCQPTELLGNTVIVSPPATVCLQPQLIVSLYLIPRVMSMSYRSLQTALCQGLHSFLLYCM